MGSQRLLRVSIRHKLYGAFAALALVTAGVGGAGLWAVSVINDAYQTVVRDSLPALSHLVQADRDMQRVSVAERTLMFMKNDSPDAKAQRAVHAEGLAGLAAHWRGYASLAATPAERARWAAFEKARADWEKSSAEVLSLLAQDSTDARKDAIDVSLNEGAARFETARTELAALGRLRQEHVAAQAAADERRIATLRWLAGMGMLAAFVAAIGLGTLLARAIVRPLQDVVARLRDVAEGEGDMTRRLAANRGDEIGEMARWFNVFMDRLHDVLVEVRRAADQVTTASREVSGTTGEISAGAQEQASSLEETAASLEEITGTVKQNADNARQANQLASGARSVAEKGGEVVAAAVQSMGAINASSNKIAAIITAIDEIAFQTNLLALNAAVEAARAGDQGRGFAVVASEVRNLAQRSASAAKEIKDLIHDSVGKVEAGSHLVNESGATLAEIVGAVKRVTDIVAEIAAASGEQSSGVDQVNRAVSQMDQVVQGNAARTEQLSSTAQELAAQAEQLQALVARFRLATDAGGAGVAAAPRVAPTPAVAARPLPPRAARPLAPPPAPKKVEAVAGVNGHAANGHAARAGQDGFEEF
jgi:methyl-accepting chemotaxis protein